MGLFDSLFNLGKDIVSLPFSITEDLITLGEEKKTLNNLKEIKKDLLEDKEEIED
jgi:hypothetical protein